MDLNKTIQYGGLALMFVSLLVTYLVIDFVNTLNELSQESCSCGETCDMDHFEIPTIFYVAMLLLAIMFVSGIVLVFKSPVRLPLEEPNARWEENVKKLEKDEAGIYKLLMDEGGTMFQSDIVERTGLSKVKVTRTLDKMEARLLLERKRRGLTNIIVLKK